jgi:hypothetical protein
MPFSILIDVIENCSEDVHNLFITAHNVHNRGCNQSQLPKWNGLDPSMFLLQGRAALRVKRFTMVNAYLQLFPNYDGVPLVSIAILVRPELRVTLGAGCDFVGGHSLITSFCDEKIIVSPVCSLHRGR